MLINLECKLNFLKLIIFSDLHPHAMPYSSIKALTHFHANLKNQNPSSSFIFLQIPPSKSISKLIYPFSLSSFFTIRSPICKKYLQLDVLSVWFHLCFYCVAAPVCCFTFVTYESMSVVIFYPYTLFVHFPVAFTSSIDYLRGVELEFLLWQCVRFVNSRW